MLTRIEIDGFKTFRDFSLDVPPFLVVLGKNAAGKSNLFDAMQFLRLLADGSILEAVQSARGDVTELFHRFVDGSRMKEMSFAVEVLLPPEVTDAFGETARVTHSRLRYEVSLGLRSSSRGQRIYVNGEEVRRIRRSDDAWITGFSPAQRKTLAIYSSTAKNLLATDHDDQGRRVFRLSQEGHQGRPRLLPAQEATATVLSSLTTATEFPLLYALKRELLSWRLLQLDPVALRAPNSYDDPDVLAPSGGNLANTLHRLVVETSTEDRPEGLLTDLAADLAAVIPEVVGVELSGDDTRRQRQIIVRTRDEAPFPAHVASDGTLRAIALLAALYDTGSSGLICFEEPENGIFPHRLARFVGHLRDLVDRALEARLTDALAPLTQLILSSHSPAILRALRLPAAVGGQHDEGVRGDVVFVDTVSRRIPNSEKSRVTRIRRIAASDQPVLDLPVGSVVSPAEIKDFEVHEELGV